MKYTIGNAKLSITVDSFGAEIVSAIAGGKERVWQNPTGEWAGHGPVLFPVCGNFGVTVDGVSYPIKAHGFAKHCEFALENSGEEHLTLALVSDENTKKVYPYDFIFRVTYRICESTLSVEYAVENPAEKPLYFACGGHESFALDTDVDGYVLVFEKEEELVHYYHDNAGRLTGKTLDYGKAKTFALPRAFLQNGETLIFKDIKSRKVRLYTIETQPLAEIMFDGFSNLLLWRADEGKFICIEPWSNLPDKVGAPDKEFSEKDGVFKVEPKSIKKLTRTIEYL